MDKWTKQEIKELLTIAKPEMYPFEQESLGETKMIERQLANRFMKVVFELLREIEDLKTKKEGK